MPPADHRKRTTCRLCSSAELRTFLQLGPQPLAGGFLTQEQLAQPEQRYPLDIAFCRGCGLVQLLDVVEKETMFSHYFYAPHSLLSPHFTAYAQELAKRFSLGSDSFVVEFGSNVGMMLKPLKDLGIRAIGVEPAGNIAKFANDTGLETVNDFFTQKSAAAIAARAGKADLVVANNVFAHIDDLEEVMRGVKALLAPGGAFVFENHYLLDTLDKLQYDDMYHEHLCYYALRPLLSFFQRHGMRVFDAERVQTHGGSIRVFVGSAAPTPRLAELLAAEQAAGLASFETYQAFAARVHAQRSALTALLASLRSQGKTIVGYGAPARGNTLLNFCRISLPYTIDDSPLRQGKLTPGTRIPIVSVERFRSEQPDYALLLAWGGYTEKILEKERTFREKGGKFIIPLPGPRIL